MAAKEKTVIMDATYDKDTPKKHRYTGAKDDVSVGVYITRNADIPKQVVINLKVQGD